jgi:C-terminal processing protease CtpA/Prc
MDTPWDETLYDFIPRFLNANNVENYRLTVRELATRLNDGHAYLDGIHLQYSRIVELVDVNGRIYIRKASSKSVLKRGDIVCKINGKDIYRIRDSIEKYIPSSNIAYTNFKVNRLLGRLIEDANSVTIEREGERHEFTSYIYSYNYFDRQSDNKSYSKLSETIGYVSLDRITESDIPKILEQFKTMNGIILDLRCYPQNYAPYYLLSCFSNKLSFHFYSVLMNDLAHPGAFQMTYPKFTCGYRWYKQEKYHGKLVVLVDESTMSAAECITMMFRAIGSTIIGRPTAGADGNIAKFSLPGNITVNFSSIGIFYPDGSETQRVGILPDIEVQPDVKSVKEGKDEILEAAMEYINEYS